MKIRSITFFLNPGWPLNDKLITHAEAFIKDARGTFQSAGYDIQTTRLATVPFSFLFKSEVLDPLLNFSLAIEAAANSAGFDYVSIGPALPDRPEFYPCIYDILKSTENVFVSGLITNNRGEISFMAINACAELIVKTAKIVSDGFANLRFAALANVPPGTPFFPAAYHEYSDNDVQPAFGLAMEAADIFNESVHNSDGLTEIRRSIINKLESNSRTLEEISNSLSHKYRVRFTGMDFTPAPFPVRSLSFGTAIEDLGVSSIGLHGSLAAAAFFADAIDRARFRRAGFNGLFFPVLEDLTLAMGVESGSINIKDLLMYSTVCGSGLDTIPLPGDTQPDELYALLLDIAFLAQRLDKPLTARLMPIPGKKAGDMTEFSFDYFVNSKVMCIEGKPIRGFLRDGNLIGIHKRSN